ncbi:hypothetical protein ACN4EG_01090 [Alkalinema pantanalense CENA528]|uniref:hypothetical protein n=1 Tax=Alkalinema pantanalense TaxID=1620705 RepID=UPI003D700AA6
MSDWAVCTIVTKSYLCYARALTESVKRHNSDVSVYVLLADRLDDGIDPAQEDFHLISLEQVIPDPLREPMCFYYTAYELCCALRGHLHEYLLNNTSVQRWLFLDGDVWVTHSLAPIFQQLDHADILLNPQNYTASTTLPDRLYERSQLKYGLYNGGCVGLKRSPTAQQFIQWFKARLQTDCFDDIAIADSRGLFLDQKWLDLVPIYFSNVGLLRHPGANVAHWNLIERSLTLDEQGQLWVNQQPLIFFHLSGWDIEQPDRISRHASQNHITVPAWSAIGQSYREALIRHGYFDCLQWPYGFATFTNGQPITLAMRRYYFEYYLKDVNSKTSPFDRWDDFPRDVGLPQSLQWLEAEVQRLQATLVNVQQEIQSVPIGPPANEIAELKAECKQLLHQRNELLAQVVAMKNSKFWWLRGQWLKAKSKFGFAGSPHGID